MLEVVMDVQHAVSRARAVLPAALAIVSMACHDASPPPRWASGGAALALPNAKWASDEGTVQLAQSGKVFVNGELAFVVDRVGRVVNDEYDPLALLMPDGSVVGTDDQDLGRLGRTNGAPPGSETAWFSIQPDGTVIFFEDGDRYSVGRWSGCGGGVRACALVSHMIFIRSAQQRRGYGGGYYGPGFGPSVGVGVGIGVWR